MIDRAQARGSDGLGEAGEAGRRQPQLPSHAPADVKSAPSKSMFSRSAPLHREERPQGQQARWGPDARRGVAAASSLVAAHTLLRIPSSSNLQTSTSPQVGAHKLGVHSQGAKQCHTWSRRSQAVGRRRGSEGGWRWAGGRRQQQARERQH